MTIYSLINSNYDRECQEYNNEISIFLNKDLPNQLVINDVVDVMNVFKKEDMVICSEISMLSLKISNIIIFLNYIRKHNIKVYCDKEDMMLGNNTDTRLLLLSLEIADNLHKKNISIKTKKALENAKNNGKQLGRPIGFSCSKLDKHKKNILKLPISPNSIHTLTNITLINRSLDFKARRGL